MVANSSPMGARLLSRLRDTEPSRWAMADRRVPEATAVVSSRPTSSRGLSHHLLKASIVDILDIKVSRVAGL